MYNNTATQWVVTNLPMKSKYMFRVAAVNALGMGEFSDSEVLSFQPYTGNRVNAIFIFKQLVNDMSYVSAAHLIIIIPNYYDNK